MDKYEYRVKTEQMLDHLEKKEYQQAKEIADGIDWRRVKNASIQSVRFMNITVSLRRGEIYCSWHLTEHREAEKLYIV